MQEERDTAEGRVRRLERRLDRATRVQLGLVLALLMQVALSASGSSEFVPDVLRTRQLEVLGPGGEQLVVIGRDDRGAGAVALYDRGGRRTVQLEADDRGAGSVLVMTPRRQEVAAAFVGVDARGDGQLGARAASGAGGASLGLDVRGSGELNVYRPNGSPATTLGVDGENAGALRVLDAAGHELLRVGAHAVGVGGLVARDVEADATHVWPARE